ncbi:hypothetical protein [Gelidibacter gilvus]|uniref:Uncharacterized protein n=1 Tax=Gelidibacter gilvus TaxID=59602 RepID=A0A4Q0XKD3_9FLAO|nr:hypothetical protein [Gelidibacter gilvus]RXJ51087.1 hypothetical protein ESZ48_04210 [Gelidibacter gilvus]
MYKVLWFDDEFNSNKGMNIIDNANEEYIELIGVTNAKVGIDMLTSSPDNYDAILLDGLFFVGDTEQENYTDIAFREVAKTILKLKAQDIVIPWFVYSGQKEFVKSKHSHQLTFEDENYGKRTYDKNSDQDQVDLWKDIIKACNERDSVRVRLKYFNPFEMCTDNYLGKKHFDRLHHLVLGLENPSQIKIAQDSLNGIRKIIEAVFAKLNEIGCIPDEIIQDQGWINGSGLFLSDKHRDYIYKQEIIHPVVAFNIYKILSVTQDGSHNEGKSLGVDAYMASNTNTFLYQSIALLLLDTLDWLKPFIDDNNDKIKNQAKWDKVQSTIVSTSLTGEVCRIADNGWGTFKHNDSPLEVSIPPALVSSNRLALNQSIEITTEPSPDGTKTFIKNIKTQL